VDVSAVARGYLSLINANNRGQGLSLAADYITPTVEVGHLLGLSKRSFYSAGFTLPAGGASQPLGSIPAGQTWIVRAGGHSFTVQAGATLTAIWGWMRPPGAQNIASIPWSATFPNQPGAAGGAMISQESAYNPFLWPGIALDAGTEFYIEGETAGGNVTGQFDLLIDVLSA